MLGSYMRKAFLSPFFKNWRGFSTIPSNINFSDYRPVYRKQLPSEEIQYTIEDFDKKITLTLPEDASVQDLALQMKERSKEIKTVKILSLDLAEYANVTKLSDLTNENHYLIVNDNDLYKIKSLDQTFAEKELYLYEKNIELCREIGLPFVERKIIMNYLKRVDILNQEKFGKKLFTGEEIGNASVDKDVIIQNLIEAIINNKNQQIEKEESLIQTYFEQKEKLEQLKYQRADLEAKAHSITKWKMSLGLFALLGQFSFVGIGTYVVYSWDIIEPLVYFITLSATILLSLQFFKTYNDYSNTGYLNYRKNLELAKLYAKYNFPIKDLEETEELVKALEGKIKSNILINL